MLLFEFGLFEGKDRIMKLEFKYDDVWYKIHFNGRSVIELRGDKLDIMELCCNLECRKEFGSTEDYASEKVKRTCVVSAFQTSDMYMKKFIYQAFRSEELYDSHDLFVVENAKAFINDEMIEIIKAHLLMPYVKCVLMTLVDFFGMYLLLKSHLHIETLSFTVLIKIFI